MLRAKALRRYIDRGQRVRRVRYKDEIRALPGWRWYVFRGVTWLAVRASRLDEWLTAVASWLWLTP